MVAKLVDRIRGLRGCLVALGALATAACSDADSAKTTIVAVGLDADDGEVTLTDASGFSFSGGDRQALVPTNLLVAAERKAVARQPRGADLLGD